MPTCYNVHTLECHTQGSGKWKLCLDSLENDETSILKTSILSCACVNCKSEEFEFPCEYLDANNKRHCTCVNGRDRVCSFKGCQGDDDDSLRSVSKAYQRPYNSYDPSFLGNGKNEIRDAYIEANSKGEGSSLYLDLIGWNWTQFIVEEKPYICENVLPTYNGTICARVKLSLSLSLSLYAPAPIN